MELYYNIVLFVWVSLGLFVQPMEDEENANIVVCKYVFWG